MPAACSRESRWHSCRPFRCSRTTETLLPRVFLFLGGCRTNDGSCVSHVAPCVIAHAGDTRRAFVPLNAKDNSSWPLINVVTVPDFILKDLEKTHFLINKRQRFHPTYRLRSANMLLARIYYKIYIIIYIKIYY